MIWYWAVDTDGTLVPIGDIEDFVVYYVERFPDTIVFATFVMMATEDIRYEGWMPFGTTANLQVALEFSQEEDDGGLPRWERIDKRQFFEKVKEVQSLVDKANEKTDN